MIGYTPLVTLSITGFLSDPLGTMASPIFDFAKNIFGAGASLILQGVEAYNNFITNAKGALTMNPETFQSGALWSVVQQFNAYMVALGASLVVLFFLMDFCSSSIDIKDNIRLETILKLFIKLSLAEFFVANNLDIVRGLFSIGTGIAEHFGGVLGTTPINVGTAESLLTHAPTYAAMDIADKSGAAGFGNALWAMICGAGVFICSALVAGVFIGSGLVIVYYAYSRAIKILTIVPFGAIAFSTLAGNHQVNHTAVSYVKFIMSTLLEATAIMVSLMLCNTLVNNGGLMSLVTGTTDSYMMYSLSICLSALLTVGMVKGSQQMVQRSLGL